MDLIFGYRAQPIVSVEEMDSAIKKLFWYRVDEGLELIYMCRRQLDMMWIDPEQYGMCSEQTKPLAELYVNRIMNGSCPIQEDFVPSLMQNLLQWFEDSYAPKNKL